jgi:hypothetical protein
MVPVAAMPIAEAIVADGGRASGVVIDDAVPMAETIVVAREANVPSAVEPDTVESATVRSGKSTTMEPATMESAPVEPATVTAATVTATPVRCVGDVCLEEHSSDQ